MQGPHHPTYISMLNSYSEYYVDILQGWCIHWQSSNYKNTKSWSTIYVINVITWTCNWTLKHFYVEKEFHRQRVRCGRTSVVRIPWFCQVKLVSSDGKALPVNILGQASDWLGQELDKPYLIIYIQWQPISLAVSQEVYSKFKSVKTIIFLWWWDIKWILRS